MELGGTQGAFAPGASVLGGAAAGLSYEGALRDAAAWEERARRRAAANARLAPPPQQQAWRREPPREQAQAAGNQ